MRTVAIWRLYYGADWIEESIRRVAPHVDACVVFFTGPLAGVSRWTEDWPRDPDGAKKTIELLTDLPVSFCEVPPDEWQHRGQFSRFVNGFVLREWPNTETVLINEYDHLWRDLGSALEGWARFREGLSVGRCAKVQQVELWKPPHVSEFYEIPHRPQRVGPIFWDTRAGEIPETVFHGIPAAAPYVPMLHLLTPPLNVGYCTSERTMRWKMKCGLLLGELAGQDSVQDPRWVDDVYLAWKPGDRNLEISLHHKHAIPFVSPWVGVFQ